MTSEDTATRHHDLAGKHIIIAGGGLAGLAFIHALDRYWPQGLSMPKITLYERRSEHVTPETEGYSISIRSDKRSGGMQALQKLGFLESLLEKSITGQQGDRGTFVLWDTAWKPILKAPKPNPPPDGLPTTHMRIARYKLRQHLIETLPSHASVRWSTACDSATVMQDKRVRVMLNDETTDECDLLVAADGANSRIRRSLIPEDRLAFAGAVCISGNAKFPGEVPKPVDEHWGILLGGGGTSLFASPIDNHSAVWNVSYLSPKPRENVRGEAAVTTKEQLVEEALTRGKAFGHPFEQLVRATAPETLMVFNAMDKQPIDHSKLAAKNTVFIGDANHAVSPFAGNGANMALMDGVQLAKALCETTAIGPAIAAFDAESMPRSKSAVKMSHWSIGLAHSTGFKASVWVLALRIMSAIFLR